MTRRLAAIVLAVAIALGVTTTTAPLAPRASAGGEPQITLTFIRHGQSLGNTSGFIDTTTPGPDLTDLGREQAHQVATDYARAGFDGVFASEMIRTQHTAEFLADELNEQIDVLPGLGEIPAGIYEGQPNSAGKDFFNVLREWSAGNRDARIPGSIDGNEFDARFDDAVAVDLRQRRSPTRRVLARRRHCTVGGDEHPQRRCGAARIEAPAQHRLRDRARKPYGGLDTRRLQRRQTCDRQPGIRRCRPRVPGASSSRRCPLPRCGTRRARARSATPTSSASRRGTPAR